MVSAGIESECENERVCKCVWGECKASVCECVSVSVSGVSVSVYEGSVCLSE
jgi:hypothetical protein